MAVHVHGLPTHLQVDWHYYLRVATSDPLLEKIETGDVDGSDLAQWILGASADIAAKYPTIVRALGSATATVSLGGTSTVHLYSGRVTGRDLTSRLPQIRA